MVAFLPHTYCSTSDKQRRNLPTLRHEMHELLAKAERRFHPDGDCVALCDVVSADTSERLQSAVSASVSVARALEDRQPDLRVDRLRLHPRARRTIPSVPLTDEGPGKLYHYAECVRCVAFGVTPA